MKYVTKLLARVWGAYALTLFGLSALTCLVAVSLIPGLNARRWFVTRACAAPFVLAGVRVEIQGRENLPDGNCVVVANHASYADGPLLKGSLPPHFSFVIKGEMRNIPVVHFVLRRGGSRFVERFAQAGSSRDARQIVKAAQDGESLGFFPEGTFTEEPGVGRFHPGAFVAAIKGGIPVVPIAISGTRQLLPARRILPRPAKLRIDILPQIAPGDPAFDDGRTLAEHARQRILAALDEPDLLAPQQT